jgi:hypothetical protein
MRLTTKALTTLRDMDSGEIMVECPLTPASCKRIIKEYARFGYYLELIN